MIECVSRKYRKMDGDKSLYIENFVMDTEADFDSLPKSAPDSYAVVADGSKKYMVNASGQWVEYSGGTGVPTEQIRNVVNDVLDEALGGEY